MRARGILLTVVVLLGVLFAVVNWSTLTTPLPVNLLFGRVEVPVGLTLLLLALLLAILFFVGAMFDRAAQLREIRRLERQLEKARGQLDARRLEEIAEVRDAVQAWGTSLERRVDERVGEAESSLKTALTDAETREKERMANLEERVVLVRNELAADVGEAEDTLRRMLRPSLEDTPPPE